jgi:hypothetical protein
MISLGLKKNIHVLKFERMHKIWPEPIVKTAEDEFQI